MRCCRSFDPGFFQTGNRESARSRDAFHVLEGVLSGARKFLGKARQGTEGREFTDQDHLHPGETGHENIDPVTHGGHIFMQGTDLHLDSSDSEGCHNLENSKLLKTPYTSIVANRVARPTTWPGLFMNARARAWRCL